MNATERKSALCHEALTLQFPESARITANYISCIGDVHCAGRIVSCARLAGYHGVSERSLLHDEKKLVLMWAQNAKTGEYIIRLMF